MSHSNRLPRFNRPLKAMFKSTAGDDVVFVERTAGCAVWLMLYFPQILYSTKSTKSERLALRLGVPAGPSGSCVKCVIIFEDPHRHTAGRFLVTQALKCVVSMGHGL